jgi:leucyl aminopeptidase
MDIRFTKTRETADILVVPVFANNLKPPHGTAIETAAARAIETDAHFMGKRGQSMSFPAPAGHPYKKIVLFGMGNDDALSPGDTEELGGLMWKAVQNAGFRTANVYAPTIKTLNNPEIAARLASGLMLKSYSFDKYKTDKIKPVAINMVTTDVAAAEAAFAPLKAVAEGAYFARDVANEPPNALYPESFAKRIESELTPLGVKVTILDENDLAKIGAGGILAVGQGSARPPRLVIMEYCGTGDATQRPDLALVGKGITFDTGGISIKPSASMAAMKFDMGGAAAVVGTMRALSGRKANSHVIGVVALAENMPDAAAYRPGDIIKSLNGKTVEIDNTDAEGRLVLMDALTYVQRNYKPKTVIDLATLTGAVRVALGSVMAGIFSNCDTLWKKISKAGDAVNEPGWRLPLHKKFTQAMQGSDYADLTNSAPGGGGSSLAAAFLQEFIEGDTKWAHCDIAAMAAGLHNHPLLPDRIGNGFGVRLLDRLVRDSFEQQKQCGPVCKGTCSRHPQP